MSDEKMIVKFESDHGEVKLSPGIIRQYLVSGSGNPTDQEIVMFLKLCQHQRLNPWLREAYLIKFGNNPATMITGKDVFTKRAAKSELFNGSESGVVVQKGDGALEYRPGKLVLKDETLVGGWAKIYRKDWEHPVQSVVSYDEYVGRKSDGSVNSQWKRMPATMIEKVAKVQALRDAFPEDFQGLYDAAEMGDAGDAPPPKVDARDSDSQWEKAPAAMADKAAKNQVFRDALPEDSKEDPVTVQAEVAPEAPKTEPEKAPEEQNDEELEDLRERVTELLSKVADAGLMTEAQCATFAKQLTTMKSTAAMRAMGKNLERTIASANQGDV